MNPNVPNLNLNNNVFQILKCLGCCGMCILRFSLIVDKREYWNLYKQVNVNSEHDCIIQLKKLKQSNCISCLGILSNIANCKLQEEIISNVQLHFETTGITFSLTLPLCLSIRERIILKLLKEKEPEYITFSTTQLIRSVKDIWKFTIGENICQLLNLPQNNDGVIASVVFTYVKDDEECNILLKLYSLQFNSQQLEKKFKKSRITRKNIDDILALTDDEQLKKSYVSLTLPFEEQILCQLNLSHFPLYIGGRYNKYSRDLPQTPWIVNGKRKKELSVQEMICNILLSETSSTEIKFSASGREDVDVRMLGSGRPFVCQLINPKKTKISNEVISKWQKDINTTYKDIALRNLQVVTKKKFELLKDGEENKKKSYIVLCWSESSLQAHHFDPLLNFKIINIIQKTPFRVLHRRPLAERQRIIENISAKLLNNHNFILQLTTQAGTYVKEFIHGDFGRTQPNLSQILHSNVDVTALDVQVKQRHIFKYHNLIPKNIDLDWP